MQKHGFYIAKVGIKARLNKRKDIITLQNVAVSRLFVTVMLSAGKNSVSSDAGRQGDPGCLSRDA